jgi:hypothetical protein
VNYEVVLNQLRTLSESWLFLAIFSVCVLVLLASTKARPIGACFAFSNVLLVTRKILLFIPIRGSISDYDHVVFWDGTNYVIYLLIMLVATFVTALIIRKARKTGHRTSGEDVGGAFAGAGCLSIIAIVILSIAIKDFFWNACRFLFVYVLGTVKLFIVNPLLLPLSFLIPLILLVVVAKNRNFSPRHARNTTAAAAICLTLASILHIGSQVTLLIPGQDPASRSTLDEIRDTWATDSKVFPNEGIGRFYEVWAGKLSRIKDSKLDIVERSIPADFDFRGSALATESSDLSESVLGHAKRTIFEWSMSRAEWMASAGLMFLILLIGTAIRIPFRNRGKRARNNGRRPDGAP